MTTARQDLVAYLKTVTNPDIQIYDSPVDVLKSPAIVVNPASPYAEPYDQGGPKSVLWGFDLVLVTSRVNVASSLARLETMASDLMVNLNGHPNTRWVEFDVDGTTDVGDVPMLTATLSVVIADIIEPT